MKKILLSLDNFLLICLSLLAGLLLFSVMKNQMHNDYIINLNNKAPMIANEIKNKNKINNEDFYYSKYSVKEAKIIESNIKEITDNKIRFNYHIQDKNDFIVISIYEKDLDYSELVKFSIYLTLMFYIAGFILFYIVVNKIFLSKELEKLQFMDSLTKLYNKVKFTQTLENQIKKKENFYVIVTNIEDFKRINQLSGYDAGDLLLKNYALSLKLKKMIKNPARISGDQFIFFIEEKDLGKKTIEETLNNMVAEIYAIDEDTYKIKQNIGVSKYPNNSLDAEELIKFAEIAMHSAKEQKKAIELYQDVILEKVNKNNMIKKELLNAIEKEEIYLVYQPKVNLNNNEIYAEVLVRWKNNNLGFVGPDIFIDIAEKTGEIYKLGKWIFEEAVKEIEKYNKENKKIFLSINLSPKQLINKYIFEDFLIIVNKHNVSPNQITLEITESVMLDKEDGFELINKFSEAGFKISIDDFGKGHSSFSYLKDYPVNEVKLDKSFIDEIEKPFNYYLVESISLLSKKLNVNLVLEGIETENQVNILKNLGCHFFQGYFYSKPLTSNDFNDYIKKRLDL